MITGRIGSIVSAALLLGGALTAALPARALDTITAGAVGSGSTTIWPIYVGIREGLFRRRRHQARSDVRTVVHAR